VVNIVWREPTGDLCGPHVLLYVPGELVLPYVTLAWFDGRMAILTSAPGERVDIYGLSICQVVRGWADGRRLQSRFGFVSDVRR